MASTEGAGGGTSAKVMDVLGLLVREQPVPLPPAGIFLHLPFVQSLFCLPPSGSISRLSLN